MGAVASATWQMLDHRITDRPMPQGLDAAWHTAIGQVQRRSHQPKLYHRKAEKVLALESAFAHIAERKLKDMAEELRALFRLGRETPTDLVRAFALIREVATRQLGLRPHLVQVMGAFAMEAGCVAEMATGEGKTLTATMPATIAGWRGRGCHVVTVNDYLAQRDAENMTGVYRFCGLNVAHIDQAMKPDDRKQAYAADITYCTNKEVTADFLRDCMALGTVQGAGAVILAKLAGKGDQLSSRLVQRGLGYALIDEADSVLIDEAVTPLIISGPGPNSEQLEAFTQAAVLAEGLTRGVDYGVNRRFQEVELTPDGREHLAELTADFGGLWHIGRRREEVVTKALTAKELYQAGRQYIIDDGKIVIVDDFTGRLMPDRSWRDGLHQAVEAKEGVEVTPPKDTYARISFQRFFRLYNRLSGMTGTAEEAVPEFWHIYSLPVVKIPPNRPCKRRQMGDIILSRAEDKWTWIADDIQALHKHGRPVLVGTRSVETSELLSEILSTRGLPHQVLNAVRHREEAQIVAEAGQPGRITVATNMAGRGTDVKLGRGVAEAGGLHVIAAERNESGRVDRQLFGRCGRQGDPGSAQAVLSLEDELVRRHAGLWTQQISRRFGQRDINISNRVTRGLFAYAQRRASSMSYRQRRGVSKTDHWLDEQLGFSLG